MTMTKSTVTRLAWLARIELSEEEVERYSKEMQQILAMIDAISGPNAEGPALAHPLAIPARLRPDTVSETGQRDQLQQGAPSLSEHHYIVPRVLPEE